MMFFNHIKVAYRLLLRNKSTSFIHMIGLSVSLGVIGIIMAFIRYETAFDQFHQQHEEVFRIAGSYVQGGTDRNDCALTNYQLAPYLATKLESSIVDVARVQNGEATIRLGENYFFEEDIFYVDPAITQVLHFDVLDGTANLTSPNQAMISRDMAIRYFDSLEVTGQFLEVDERSLQIVGVYEYSSQSHLSPQMLITLETVESEYSQAIQTNWSAISHYTYLRLAPGVSETQFEEQLTEEIPNFYPYDNPPEYQLQPVASVHLSSDLSYEIEVNGNWSNLYYLAGAALLILIIASINYINITSASALKRAKEIGVKKVFGFGKGKIIGQFQIEAITAALIAYVLSLFLSEWLQVQLSRELDIYFGESLFQDLQLAMILLIIAVVQGIIAGSFPPLLLLQVDIVSSLKGKLDSNSQKSSWSMRDLMVTLQFSIAIALLIISVTIFRQMEFMVESDKGYDTKQLITVDLQTRESSENHELIKTRLARIPGVVGVAATGNMQTARIGGWRPYRPDTTSDNITIPTIVIDEDYFSTLGVTMSEGRAFSKDYPSDATRSYIINRKAQQLLGGGGNLDAFLQGWAFTGENWTMKDAKIIGIVEDFHFASMHDEIQPTVFSLASEITANPFWLLIRIEEGRNEEVIENLSTAWSEMTPNRPFQYEYVDQALADHYSQELNLLRLITLLAIIGMVISLVGLLGLTMFIIQGRIKEMSIRKVLGANLIQVLRLFLGRFATLIVIANLVAWPIAFMINSNWLENFSYHVDIGWVWYGLVGLAVLALAFLAISTLVVNASRLNPVDTLKDE
ncbi:MAG: ABC transporter permease [Cytophagales bacterium]|nr:ABC transporter permease [Cytophagales bacterium]